MGSDSPMSKVLEQEYIEENIIRKICFGGIESKHRPFAWRIIFQTVGLKKGMYESYIKTQDIRYMYLLKRNIENKGETFPLGFNLRISEKTKHQIDIDIKRLEPQFKIWKGTDISYMYYNILHLIATRRPCLGYIQGMADILVPFVLTFASENLLTAESSSYFCYTRLLDKIQYNIVSLQSRLICRLDRAIEHIDPEFYNFLKDLSLEIHMFAFRWFNCFFIREFKISDVYKILDTTFSFKDINEFLICFGVALVMNFKNVLTSNDFSKNIIFLQNLEEKLWEESEIEMILSSAKFYYNILKNIM